MGGLEFSSAHVRKAALPHGALTPLRVLIMEARVDVRGLELLQDHRQGGALSGSGGWIQRCKPALKALMARGSIFGTHSLQSKLLKRVEEDGMALWIANVMDGLRRDRPDLPDLVLSRI